MEMPIRIIVALFVAIIVALAIVKFTSDSINDSKQKLKDFGVKEEVDEEKIMELDEVSSYQIGIMAKECHTKNSNVNLESELCFVLLGNVNANNNAIKEASKLEDEQISVDLSSAKNAVRIRYNAALDRVEVFG